MESKIRSVESKTIRALLWMNISNEPFVVLYALMPFVMRKDLHASILQLSILASLRPILSIFSFYWSANLTHQKHRLRSNLIGAWALARLPFLFVPWIGHAWYIIFACGMYELLNRSGNPALMEILKINLQKDPREQIYSWCFVLSFLESILLGIVVSCALKNNLLPWQILLGITSVISLSSIFLQSKVPIPSTKAVPLVLPKKIGEKIFKPWKDAFSLLRSNPSFFRMQCGFMFGGVGLMLTAPSLPLFCVDILSLSHSEITTARSILMGLGVAVSSYFWKKMIAQEKTDLLLRNVLIGFSLYLFLLYFSKLGLFFFYLSFILYGLSQAGSHLLWNLSGPIFSGREESSQFSRVNILMVGLRGSVTPAMGGILCKFMGPSFVIFCGALICLSGAFYMLLTRRAGSLFKSVP